MKPSSPGAVHSRVAVRVSAPAMRDNDVAIANNKTRRAIHRVTNSPWAMIDDHGCVEIATHAEHLPSRHKFRDLRGAARRASLNATQRALAIVWAAAGSRSSHDPGG